MKIEFNIPPDTMENACIRLKVIVEACRNTDFSNEVCRALCEAIALGSTPLSGEDLKKAQKIADEYLKRKKDNKDREN